MELEFLGTGAGVPAKHRNVTSIALRLLDERNAVWLFDCGEGTQMQILHSTIRPRKIEKIFITHLHGDHIYGLPGLISSRSFQGGDTPLEIYGPKGIKAYIQTVLRISQTKVSYPLHFSRLKKKGFFLKISNLRYLVCPLITALIVLAIVLLKQAIKGNCKCKHCLNLV